MRKLIVIVAICLCSPAFAQWYIATVDTTNYTGIYGTSIALDSLDIPHIAYCQYQGNKLMYASFNSIDSTWILEDVPEKKSGGTEPSLQLDSLDYPHITYCEGNLGYAWKDSTGWHDEIADPWGWIYGNALVLDSKDRPHIAFGYEFPSPYDSNIIAYTYKDSAGWHRTILDTVGTLGYGDVSMVLDKNDNPHIAYPLGYPNHGIAYAKQDSGIWTIEIIDSAGYPEYGNAPSIVLDSFGFPNIAYSCWYNDSILGWTYDLKYAVRTDKSWLIEKVENLGEPGGCICLQLDKNDNPHIAYLGDKSLKYAWKNDNKWYIDSIEQIITDGIENTYFGLVIDRNNFAHISYSNQIIEGRVVRYARGYAIGAEENSKFKAQSSKLEIQPTLATRGVEISYALDKKEKIELGIYNLAGQKVVDLVNMEKPTGTYNEHWMTDKIKNGIYFCRLRTDRETITKKLIVIK